MAVVRLSQLAREYGTTKKDLMDRLPDLGFRLKKSTVDIDEKLAGQIRLALDAASAPAAAGAASAPAVADKPAASSPAAARAPSKDSGAKAETKQTASAAPASRAAAPAAPVAPAAPTAKHVERPATPQAQRPDQSKQRSEPKAKPAPPERTAARPASPAPTPAPAPAPAERSAPAAAAPPAQAAAAAPVAEAAPTAQLRPLVLSEGVSIKELSEKLGLKSKDIIKRLLDRGVMATINQTLDAELVRSFVQEFGYEARIASFEEVEGLDEIIDADDSKEGLVSRPPVVTIMGHVDHGKTSLLDAIRESNVAAGEAGAITQHIGAYQVSWKNRFITFVDTPGHEAFTLMRARGARVTDIVVLVVAADDGVMPQTIEAIDHARAAGVPIVVAINKIDVPGSRLDRVKQQLADRGLMGEEWGGDTVMVSISAKQRLHIDELLELILLVADLGELKANPKRGAHGVVLEAKLDRGRGPVATVLVQNGTLNLGDPFIAGAVYGKVRAMFDDYGKKLDSAPPSTPVEVLGLQGMPQAGDAFQVVADDWRARQIGSFRQQQLRDRTLLKSSRLTLTHLHDQIAQGKLKELPIVLKADTQGSVEVLAQTLPKLSSETVKLRILHSGTGAINETDVLLAAASNAIIIAFNVRPEGKARELIQKEGVDVRLHSIIYNVTNEIDAAIKGLLEPTFEQVTLGRAEVRQVFRAPKIGAIAGCYVLEGKLTRDAQLRVLRDNVVIFESKIGSLRRFKDDASEVRTGYECGISVANYQDLKEGDVLEAFGVQQVEPKNA